MLEGGPMGRVRERDMYGRVLRQRNGRFCRILLFGADGLCLFDL